MTKLICSITLLVCLSAILGLGSCRTISKRAVVDPHSLQVLTQQSIVREKRKVDVVTGVKNAVLGFVFNGLPASKGFAWEIPKTTSTKRPTTTEDTVMFTPGEPVSLQIPDKIFGTSFNLITNVSNTVGDYMMNTALRAQRLLESMRPFLRTIFGAGGVIIEGPTDRPLFSDPKAA